MSKSRRAAGERVQTPPREKLKWYRQTGWLLAVSLVCYALVALGLRLALGAGFGALFRAWGVDAATALRAPGWARLVYRWHGSFITLIVAAATIALSKRLRGLWRGTADHPAGDGTHCTGEPVKEKSRPRASAHGGLYVLIGIAAALLILAVSLLPDSIRAEWAAPRLTWALPVLIAVTFVSTLAEELFTKRVLYDGVGKRWGSLWATAISAAAFFLIAGGLTGSAVSAVNVALMGVLTCLVYRRSGLWASVGLRFGWSAATVFLLGFGGGEASVWRFYGVSESLLTGGDAGFVYGLYMTALLAGGIAWLLVRKRRHGNRLSIQ